MFTAQDSGLAEIAYQRSQKVDVKQIKSVLGRLDGDLALIELKTEETFDKVVVYLGKQAFKEVLEQHGSNHQGFLIVDSTAATKKLVK